jgi:hypothetical protein
VPFAYAELYHETGIPEVQETTSGDVNCGTAFAKEEGQSGPGYYFIWS